MDEQDIHSLAEKIEEIRDSQEDISRSINGMLDLISDMEKQFDKDYNLSFVLASLREKLESIGNIFDFIDDVEEEIDSLSYNYRRAAKANDTSVYKVANKQIPLYYKP